MNTLDLLDFPPGFLDFLFCSRLTSFSFYKKFEDEINEAAAPRFAGATGGGSGTEPSLPKGAERTPALQGRTGKAAYSSGSPDHSACEETAPSASCPAPSLSFRDWLEGGHPRLAALRLLTWCQQRTSFPGRRSDYLFANSSS